MANGKWSGTRPVEPTAGQWRMFELPKPERFKLPPPPDDDSDETLAELEELRRLTGTRRGRDVEEILRWSTRELSVATHWGRMADDLIGQYQLSPPAGARVHALMSGAIYCALVVCWREKYRYLRLRPTQLDPRIDVSIIPVPEHPAYPSGHATAAGAAYQVLRSLFPRERAPLKAMAEEAGQSRLKAGIHYRSDYTEGINLGRDVGAAVLASAAKDGAPQRYE